MNKYGVLLLLLVSILCGCKGKGPDGSDVRPQDFPAFLQVPDNATRAHYLTEQNSRMIKGAYSLSYFVEDEFPPETSIKFVHEQLRKAGYFPLKYSLLNQNDSFANPYLWSFNKRPEPGYIYLERLEKWCHTESLESLFVSFTYRCSAKQKQVPSELNVYLGYNTEDAQWSALVKKYKEKYPPDQWETDIEMTYDEVWNGVIKQGRIIENK